jgi:hypothetical protein
MINTDNVFPIACLIGTAIAVGAGYGAWNAIRDAEPLSPIVLSQLSPGCVTVLLTDKLARGQKPVTRWDYEDMEHQCEKEARDARAMAQSAVILQKQRDAMASTNSAR